MIIQAFTVSPFQSNCYVCHRNGSGVLIDPGCATATERRKVIDYISRNKVGITHLLLTHGHIDHVLDCAYFARHFRGKFQMHADDVPLLHNVAEQGRMFGLDVEPPPEPGRLLTEGDEIAVGNVRWKVLHTPGHSPGSICFYDRENGFLIAGDVLFAGSIGRTDLWRGSYYTLLESIRTKLLPLPDDTTVYSGHGPATTIGRERNSNPFLIEELRT